MTTSNTNKVELMAPARNFKTIKAIVNHADSVYFGIKRFNMRMKTENIDIEDLSKVTTFCHDNHLKCYLATNILVYDNELTDIREILFKANDAEIDAVIVNDLAVLEMARDIGIPFHISTQCNVSNSIAAKFYENLGADRIVLARELSLEKVKEVKRNLNKTGIEVFVHGAMCTSVSGRCYFSQDICGSEEKSANRGNCTQPCRRRWWLKEESGQEYIYDGVRFLNSRDLCTIAYIPKLIEANIDAFKIEGRMKHPHYVETVTATYREAIEAYYNNNFTEAQVGRWVTTLKKVYNRGFTPGFYFKRCTPEDQQHNYPANLSHYRYIKIGIIDNFNPETKFANISLFNGSLKENDDVIILGRETNTYIHQNINKLRYKGEIVKRTPKASKNNIIKAELKILDENEAPIGKGEDKIFIFTNKTYEKKSYKL